MINGLYSSAAGMLGQLELQDAISNNLANANTPGFRRSSVRFEAELRDAEQNVLTTNRQGAGCVLPVGYESKDLRRGVLSDTSDPTNLAIDGAGSFVVGSTSSPHLTRSGNFHLDSSGDLVTQFGESVLGQNGPIRVNGTDWSISTDGVVSVNGKVTDKLRIEDAAGKPAGRVLQGRLEGSNVNTVQEMVGMITGLRSYEAVQKAIQNLDQTLDKVINVAGRGA